jgi:hypothetical protein
MMSSRNRNSRGIDGLPDNRWDTEKTLFPELADQQRALMPQAIGPVASIEITSDCPSSGSGCQGIFLPRVWTDVDHPLASYDWISP